MREGLNLIMEFEGFSATSYRDIVGVWTIGYGETKGVGPGMTTTKEKALAKLEARYDEFERGVLSHLNFPVTPNELGALVSLAYNIGLGAFSGSTLVKQINAQVPAEIVAKQFIRWNKAGGRVISGLTRRREAETALFLTPEGTQN